MADPSGDEGKLMADDRNLRVTVDNDSAAIWIVVVVLLVILMNLHDPGCVVKVNGTYYNVRIGEQAKQK